MEASQIETPLLKVTPPPHRIQQTGLQVPFESLKRAAKERKSLVDDATRALSGLTAVAQDTALTQEGASAHLGSIVEKLTHLKRKVKSEIGMS